MTAPTVDRMDTGVVDLSDRRPRRRRRIRIALMVLLVVVLAAGVWAVWFSSLLSVRQVRVVGTDDARAAQVLAAAAVPVGIPLVQLDAGSAERAVRGLAWVREVEVRRGWPSEAVIAVTTRVPLAVLASGRAVDADGVVFDVPGAVTKGLPRVEAQGDALTETMAVLASLPAELSRKVTAASATTRDDVALRLRSGDLVRWGSADQAAFKAQVLAALMNRKAEVYDVSAPELPTTFKPAS